MEAADMRILGIILDENLKWNKNTEAMCKKAASKLWLLRRLKQFDLGQDILTDFYKKRS